ncbi:MAG: hypothetical protein K0Q59_5080 [Paenibacillus sp.]|nr:hypothetical protein [Paenibacillus sp.]
MSIPVFVISGFLGSGKTTLLLRLLNEIAARRLRPGVLMNELGQLDVDGSILEEHTQTVVQKLLDGCVCCSKKGELLGALQLLVEQQPDVIVIELTGVANPEEIAETITEPGLKDTLRLNRVITVLDAEHVLDYNSIFAADKALVRTLRRQIEVADLLVLNKIDLVPEAKLAKIEKTIRKYNEPAPFLPTTHSRIDAGMLLGDLDTRQSGYSGKFSPLKPTVAIRGAATLRRETVQSFSRVTTVLLPWTPNERVTRARVEKWLRDSKERLLRAKGYLRFSGEPTTYLMQFAGNRTVWERSAYAGEPYVVVIGLDLDTELLTEQWRKLFV